MIRYDEKGVCTSCGLPGTGFLDDGVCQCLEREEDRERWMERIHAARLAKRRDQSKLARREPSG